MLNAMASRFQVVVALAVVFTVAFITIHPNFDLLDAVTHGSHDLTAMGPFALAVSVEFARPLAAHPSPETDSLHKEQGPRSLDLLCVRIC